MTDLSDLAGVFPSALRWNSEAGELIVIAVDEAFEREPRLIELDTSAATFAMDMATRQRGYGLIITGFYKMVMTPVGSPPPAVPEPIKQGGRDLQFKAALSVFLWNPIFGELRTETNAYYYRQAIASVWERYRTFKEAAAGLQPIIRFAGKREIHNQQFDKMYWAPVIDIVGWTERSKIASFERRPVTVPPPAALDVQIPYQARQDTSSMGSGEVPPSDALQERLQSKLSETPPEPRPQSLRERVAKPGTPPKTGDLIDDDLPW